MKFASLQYLWLLWIIPGISLVLYLADIRRQHILSKLITRDLWAKMIPGFEHSLRALKFVLLLLGILFLIVSLLRPQWGFTLREIKRKGVDLFVVVDTSDSMQAQDVEPNRIERVKRELKDLLNHLHGDRIGLIPFAGMTYIACPLTADYDAFQLFIDQLDTDLVPIQGTDLAGALSLALQGFEPGESRSKAILLLTDGEVTVGNMKETLQKIQEAGIRIFAMGVGTEKGAPIPSLDGNGFKSDSNNNIVISKLNEDSLKELALATNGIYVRSVPSDQDLEAIYVHGIKESLEEKEFKTGKKEIPEERFQILLFFAIIFLGLEAWIGERKKIK